MSILKSLFRPIPLFLVAVIFWTCRLTDTQSPDTLTLKLPDSLKASAGKYDSIHVLVVVVRGPDTTYRRLVFHGAYDDSTQLRNLPLPGLPSDEFTVILIGYRGHERVLEGHLSFKDGSSTGSPVIVLVIPPGGGGPNRPPYQSLAAPDAAKESFRIREGKELSFRVVAGDSDGGDAASRLSLTNPLPSECGSPAYDTATGQLRFTAAFACVDSMGDSAEATLRFVARDRGNPPLYDTLRLTLVVLDSNSAPRWAKTQDSLLGKEGKPMSFPLDSLFQGDLEGDSVSFHASLGSVSGQPPVWRFNPGYSDSGWKAVVITATDNHRPPLASQFNLRAYVADSVRDLDVVIHSPPNGHVTRDTVVAVRWRVNGQEQPVRNDTLRREGDNIIRRSFTDSTGSMASDSIMVILDRIPPNRPVVTAPGPTNNHRPTWTWRSGGNGGVGAYRIKLDDTALSSGATFVNGTSFTPSADLSEGSHTLFIQERDSAGNWSQSGSALARVDLTPPGRPVFDSTPLSPLNSLRPRWTWKSGGGEGMGVFRCAVDDSTFGINAETQDSQAFIPRNDLSVGRHVLYVQERDSAGNWSVTAKRSLVLAVRGMVGPKGFATAVGSGSPSLAVAPDGTPYLAFPDAAYGGKVSVMRFDGKAWIYAGNPGFLAGGITAPSLAISHLGGVYLGFPDSTNGGKAAVVLLEGNSWTQVGKAGFSDAAVEKVHLTISKTKGPYAAFYDGGVSPMAMRFNNTFWEHVGEIVDTAVPRPPYNIAVVAQNDTAFLAYTGDVGQNISVIKIMGSSWIPVGQRGFYPSSADHLSLELTPMGQPIVSFNNVFGIGWNVMEFFNGQWVYIGGPDFIDAGKAEIAISNSGDLFIAFSDRSGDLNPTVLKRNGSGWQKVGEFGFEYGAAFSISAATGPDGVPIVAYSDFSGKITVIRASFDP